VNGDLDTGLAIFANNLEREMLHVILNVLLVELASNQSLDIEDGILWVVGELILCGISDKTLFIGEGDPRRCYSVTLIVDEDFDWRELGSGRYGRDKWSHTFAILHDTDTRVSGTQIDTNDGTKCCGIILFLESFLVIGADGGEKERCAEDEEKIEEGLPCEASASSPRTRSHCKCEVSKSRTGD
jgi:hypothetical protein